MEGSDRREATAGGGDKHSSSGTGLVELSGHLLYLASLPFTNFCIKNVEHTSESRTFWPSSKKSLACQSPPVTKESQNFSSSIAASYSSINARHCIGWLGACTALLGIQAAQRLALSLLGIGPALQQITYHKCRSQSRGELSKGREERDRRWRREIAGNEERSQAEKRNHRWRSAIESGGERL